MPESGYPGPFHPRIDPELLELVAKKLAKDGLVEFDEDGKFNNRWKTPVAVALFRAILTGALPGSAIKVFVDDLRETRKGKKGMSDRQLVEAFRKEIKK